MKLLNNSYVDMAALVGGGRLQPDEFEAIAKAEKITNILEGGKDMDAKIKLWREKLAGL